MTAYQLQAGLPPITLDNGCTLTVEAIDPNTGAAVSGVTVSQVTLYAYAAAAAVPLDPGPTFLAFEPLT